MTGARPTLNTIRTDGDEIPRRFFSFFHIFNSTLDTVCDLGRFLWEAETLAEWGRYAYVLCDTYPVRNVETRDGR